MTIKILVELDDEEQKTLERYGIVYGHLRAEPRKPWTAAERKERIKWAIKHMFIETLDTNPAANPFAPSAGAPSLSLAEFAQTQQARANAATWDNLPKRGNRDGSAKVEQLAAEEGDDAGLCQEIEARARFLENEGTRPTIADAWHFARIAELWEARRITAERDLAAAREEIARLRGGIEEIYKHCLPYTTTGQWIKQISEALLATPPPPASPPSRAERMEAETATQISCSCVQGSCYQPGTPGCIREPVVTPSPGNCPHKRVRYLTDYAPVDDLECLDCGAYLRAGEEP